MTDIETKQTEETVWLGLSHTNEHINKSNDRAWCLQCSEWCYPDGDPDFYCSGCYFHWSKEHPYTPYFDDVCTFHKACSLPVETVPKVPTNERVALRRRLIEEEYEELIEALHEGDLAHIAKEAADVIVVVLGAMAEYGIPFDEVWKAVHASNMAKVGEDGKVARREDGKVLKPDGWEPPDIKKIIDEAIGRQE